jgi:hypothetical protein
MKNGALITTPIKVIKIPFWGVEGIIMGNPQPRNRARRNNPIPSQVWYSLNNSRIPLFYH